MDKGQGKRPAGLSPAGDGLPFSSHATGLGGISLGGYRRGRELRAGRYIRYVRDEEHRRLTPAERSTLANTISVSVVPELMLRHGNEPLPFGPEDTVEIDVDGLVSLLLNRDNDAFKLFQSEMELLRDAPAHVCDQFVRSVISRVGEMWSDDTAGFYEVTLAAARLQSFVREKVQQAATRQSREQQSRRILLAKVSGDELTLGLLVVTACFQEAGWEVSGGTELSCGSQMFRALADSNFAVLGLSVGVSVETDNLAAIIAKARSVSANRHMGICLGGPALMADRDRFAGLNVDFVATDALSAVKSAEAQVA
jgi:methanogenic corrinoid protein MtbC1